MQINVKLFAAARQYCGCEDVTLELADDATVRDLRASLATDYPALDAILPASMIALDHDYASDDRHLDAGVEVALIPPVSGG